MKALKNKFFAVSLLVVMVLPVFFAFAQNSGDLQQAQNEQDQLQQQLEEIQKQITQYEQQLQTIAGQKNTLQNKIKQLQSQQSALNLQIKATNLRITNLENQLKHTQLTIDDTMDKISVYQIQMAQLIRTIDEYDNYPLVFTIISQNNLSDTFDEIERRSQVFSGLNDVLNKIKETKNQLDAQAQILADQQDEAKNLLSVKVLQQQKLIGSVSEQSTLLKQTKGIEKNYQAALSDSQKKAVEIRTRLYQLLGVSNQITFGEAVEIAKWASAQTGVRAAFLLAILTQESNLGKNVGTCNRPGDPPEKSWRVVMKPSRDQEPFQAITSELGMNTDITPVSCPMRDSRGNQIGWGGAMGPAQFIPSTWMGYKDKVTEITGRLANPWDIRDAFLAAAIKLKAGGAGTVAGEWAAAMRYFSGSTNTKYRFYGDNVVAMANQYQGDIDTLNAQ
jgi:peptidoglycan hydrolase CwlO-like protein